MGRAWRVPLIATLALLAATPCSSAAASRKEAAASAANLNAAPAVNPDITRSIAWWDEKLAEAPSGEARQPRACRVAPVII